VIYSVNAVVPSEMLISTALEYAKQITQNSPDAVQSTKRALILAAQTGDVERATVDHAWSAEGKRNYTGANIKVGGRFLLEIHSRSCIRTRQPWFPLTPFRKGLKHSQR
jgi:enoyl-CoA hydratase/carnithine racemase